MFYSFLFIFGLAIGSFLNVLIDRLPNFEGISGRSHCDHCSHKLSYLDLIPVFSFLVLKGRCRYCKKKISPMYPIVEILTAVMFVVAWVYLPIGESLSNPVQKGIEHLVRIAYLGIIACLIVIIFTDLKYQIIPDSLQIAFFVFSLFAIGKDVSPLFFVNRVLAALLVMTPILLLHLLTHGRGMGFGDVKLAFTIGFLLGIKSGLISLYLAFISGALVGLIMILFKQVKLKSKIAFGPFLALGTAMMLFYGEKVIVFVNRIYGF